MSGLKYLCSVGAVSAAMLAAPGVARPALANPLHAPTADFILDVEVTRDIDHALKAPARYVSVGRRFRVDYNGLATLYDISRKTYEVMIPRVRMAAKAQRLDGAVIDNRRWIGVEARTAEPAGTTTMLGRQVMQYRVTGAMFESRVPFEGEVWTTAENIVVKVEGVSKVGRDAPTRIEVTAIQIAVGNIDDSLVLVPKNFVRAKPKDVYTADDK